MRVQTKVKVYKFALSFLTMKMRKLGLSKGTPLHNQRIIKWCRRESETHDVAILFGRE